MTQPTALFLADILEDGGKPADIAEKAAAELRRLHAELERCKQVCAATAEAWREEAALGCDHCNQPLYAAIKCRVCGRVTEPVQEPVAWIHTDPDKRRVKFLEWRENEPGYRGDWIKTPLYAAPPQRKPLTEEEALDIARTFGAQPWPPGSCVAFARAIERAHGIGVDE